MATQTLLTMVQNILSEMSSDEVNSISDTTESMQVANIIQSKFYDIIARGTFPLDNQLFQLNPSNDSTKPVLMYVPAGIGQIQWIKYFDDSTQDGTQDDQFGAYSHDLNTDIVGTNSWSTTSSTSNTIGKGLVTFTVASSILPITIGQGALCMSGANNMFGTVTSYSGTTLVINITSYTGSGTFTSWVIQSSTNASVAGYKYVTMLPIDQFIDYVLRFNPSDSDVFSYTFQETGDSFTFYYKNDVQPSYCTILSNQYILFDAYNNVFDNTLQGSKTMCFGQVLPPFSLVDTYTPLLNDNQFSLLFNEAKALAFYTLKQMPHALADREIQRQWAVAQKTKSVSNRPSYFDELSNFGRVPRTGGYSSGGYGAYKWMRGGGGSP